MLFSFRGGIHPPENKAFTEELKYSDLAIPAKCYIPLQQHIGAPASPLVEVGDTVTEGQLIGAAKGFISANVHASVSGTVTAIENILTIYQKQPVIVIDTGEIESTDVKRDEKKEWSSLSKNELIQIVSDAGIVGLGGAAFPTSVKLSPPPEKTIDTLIINGAECEPYLTVDDLMMQTFPNEIIEGIQITLKILGITKAIIGVEDNKSKAFDIINEALNNSSVSENISIQKLKTKYPQGAEKQLIYTILKKEVPSKGLPMDIGVVVQNVGTIFAIQEAVVTGKPLYERYITVSGSLIQKPGNYKVKIGTTIADIVEECGGLKGDPDKIVVGGPMCGQSIASMEIPVVKGTSGILFLSKDEIASGDFSSCIKCGRCVSACPINLLPSDLGNAVEMNRPDLAEELHPFDCIMCGCCTFVCPARRPNSHFIKLAQEKLRQNR